MRRTLATAVLALVVTAGVARAADIGIGFFAGTSIPIVQDDNGTGSVWGIRAPVKLVPLVTIEPFFASTSGGEAEQDVPGLGTVTRDGVDITCFGVNALFTFGAGLQFYPYVGIGSSSLSRENSEDRSGLGWGFGLGLGFAPIPKLSVHVRGGLDVASGEDTVRQFGVVTGGVSYSFFSFPPLP